MISDLVLFLAYGRILERCWLVGDNYIDDHEQTPTQALFE